ncbi:uncharacterized protein RJT21DRAFT_12371 [Scheffersomyces amazonensis]|uniref:uncharacterized protein n=1 Tax=Scheffersomyces amazonensis TaxID=1078765 RepID=UPI00315DD67F
MSDLEDFEGDAGLFEEPDDFRPPPPESHFATYKRKLANAEPSEITLKLVGKSPLWGHLLWNAGIFTADYLDKNAVDLVKNKKILELGAASGLPGLVSALNDAKLVVSTDYPDPDLLSHIQYNFDLLNEQYKGQLSKYIVKGYIWGNNVGPILYPKEEEDKELSDKEISEVEDEDKFDLIILSDLVFNHTEHHKLLTTCRKTLKKDGKCLVVFSPHRPHLLHKDLEFFETAEKEYEFKSHQVSMVNWTPMFQEDEETVEIRSRVYCFLLSANW